MHLPLPGTATGYFNIAPTVYFDIRIILGIRKVFVNTVNRCNGISATTTRLATGTVHNHFRKGAQIQLRASVESPHDSHNGTPFGRNFSRSKSSIAAGTDVHLIAATIFQFTVSCRSRSLGKDFSRIWIGKLHIVKFHQLCLVFVGQQVFNRYIFWCNKFLGCKNHDA